MEENKKDKSETALTIVGIIAGVLLVAEWTLYFLINAGVLKF
jgi:hypothetical protein